MTDLIFQDDTFNADNPPEYPSWDHPSKEADPVIDAIFDGVSQRLNAAKAAKPAWRDHPNHVLHDKIVAHYAPLFAVAMRDSVHGIKDAIAEAKASAKKSLIKAAIDDAHNAVKNNITFTPENAADVIKQMLGDAYLAGSHVAAGMVGGGATVLQGLENANTAMDWDNWTPGWDNAAGNVRDGGLAALLDQADATIVGINGSVMTRLGNVLADGIARGDSVQTISESMSDIISDPGRAFVIANTETARSMTQSTLSTYDLNGVKQYEWLSEDDDKVCPDCLDLNGQQFDVDESPEQPPEHPSCRCAILPVVSGQEYSQPSLDDGVDDDGSDGGDDSGS